LTSLDLSANTSLETLWCHENQLTSLDVSGNTTLRELLCRNNLLSSLDVGANASLNHLWCANNQLTSLDVSSNTVLTRLDCWSNQLHSLNVRNGNNASIINFNAALNPALSCITVSDVAYAEANWTNIDQGVIFSEGGCSVYIPDANFKAALVGNSSINTNGDAEIQYSEAESYRSGIYIPNLNITDLTGLGAFTSISELDCSYNQLSTLDLRKNTALMVVYCQNNQLGSLYLRTVVPLEYLVCSSNQLTSLDLSQNSRLLALDCSSNQLSSLDFYANTALTDLNCSYNQLSSLDLSRNTALEGLFCNFNQLTNLDASGSKVLRWINCSSNQLTRFNPGSSIALQWINCSSNTLNRLDVGANTALQALDCSSNQLATLNLSANPTLNDLDCSSNQLNSLNLRNGSNNLMTIFNSTGNPSLSCITVSDETYASANWTNIDPGVVFSEGGCSVYIPDANFKAALVGNSSINTNDDTEIQYIEAETYTGSIDVGDLSITDMTGLEAFRFVTSLNCPGNDLTMLDVRFNTALEQIDCADNQLSLLAIGANTALELLYCADNQISVLDLQSNANLSQLQCQSNLLEFLDLSNNSNLTELQCQSNQLLSMDVKNGNNESITLFDARSNPMLTCIAVDDEAYSATTWTNVDSESLFNEQGCAVVYIPDPAFKAALLANTSINTNSDAEIQYSEAAAFTGMMDVHALGISDMTGLEAFTGLSGLDCSSNLLNELDVASNELLEQLDCAGNQLSRLAVRSNSLLTNLNCESNVLELLDLRENIALTELRSQSNQLNSLDIRNGANQSITHFDARDNPPLTCITVDDASYSAAEWSQVDAGAIFSESSCIVYIPDAKFKAALVGNSSVNSNGDEEIQISEAEAYGATLFLFHREIIDMTGLEAFTSLTSLFCNGNQLTGLDVSANTALEYLNCSSNHLRTLNVHGSAALVELDCQSNQLSVMDLGSNIALQDLDCSSNRLIGLDVRSNTALRHLECSSNELRVLDVGSNTALQSILCSSNQLGNIDLDANSLLENLQCQYNQIAKLDLSANTSLEYLDCSSNKLNSLVIRNGRNGLISFFDSRGNAPLSCITVSDVAFAEANWTNIDPGVVFSEGGCNVYIPDANFKASLVENTLINTNEDEEIQFSEAEAYADGISATNQGIFDITGLEAFKNVSSINLSGNYLMEASLRANPHITSLDCSSNNLKGIDLGNNPLLESISIPDNRFTALDVSNNTVLKTLDCSGNKITGLDVGANTALESLACNDNLLTSLNVRNGHNSQITEFDATNNPYLTCISVDDEAYSNEHWTNIDVHTSFNNDCGFAASFEADVLSGQLPLAVQFTDRSTNNADVWLWDFGDGNGSDQQSPSHTYTTVGKYTVSLTISDGITSDTEVKSELIEVLKRNQTITFGALDNKTFGDADFGLTAIASSGLGVSYTSSDLTVATIDGIMVTIVGAGTTTITASQAGDDNYLAATEVQQTLTVEKAAQTITFGALDNKTFGDADFDLSATVSSGLDVSYTSSDLTVATIDGNTVIIVGAGTTTITASQAGDDNYLAATEVQQTLTVEKAAQTITFGALDNKTFGDADFDLTVTASSGLDVSYTSSDLTVATIDGNTVIIVGAGTTTITASQAGDGNYLAATDVQQTLTVEKAAQTITFGALDNKTFGDADFGLTATASSGLDVSYTSSDLTVATIDGNTVIIVGAGTTTITASQAGDGNYLAATDVQQTLTVEKAAQTITFGALDNKTFGDADFGLTATASSGLDVSYTSSDLTVATIDGNTVIIVGAGTTTITASQAGDDNYNAATEVQQTLTVEQAAQTITFGALDNKTFGDADFDLTATASSGLDVSYTSSDLTVATIDGNTVTIVGAGTTTITASQAGDDNYHAADPVAQTLEVMEITALTVEEDDRILVYPNPASSTMILQFESGMRSVRMLNLNGQTVYEKHGIDKLAGRLEIDTSPFPPGEYIIRFEGEGKTTARKVLISR
jgi:Leucine-rich repeat (LRR) protein